MTTPVQYVLTLKDLLSARIKAAEDSVVKFEDKMKRAQGAANGLATAVGVAFGTAAVVAFGQKMIEAGTTVENALTGLTTLLKDKAEAQKVINQTMEDATKTPFAFEGLLAANKALISAGASADRARTDVLNLANAIAATGGGDNELQRMVVNLQQIKNTGKATALDIKQFAYAGINIYKVLADSTNQPIEKVREMEVTYEQLTMALARAAGEGGVYANGLANMANNTSVQISNLGDSIFQLSVQMFNDLKPAISTIISGLADFIGMMRDAWKWVMDNKEAIAAAAITIGAATVAYQVYLFTIGQGAIYTGLLTAAQWALNVAMNANPIGIIITGLGLLVGAVVYAYNTFGTFRAVLWGVWGTIKAWAQLVVDTFQGVYKTIKGVLTFDAAMVVEGWNQAADAMVNSGKRLADGFKKGYDEGMADFAKDQASKKVKAPGVELQTGTTTPGKGIPGAPQGLVPGASLTGGKGTGEGKNTAQTKRAEGAKSVTINVSIGSLIKDFKIQTTNITEGAGRVREMVAQALVSATNDSQLIAGQ